MDDDEKEKKRQADLEKLEQIHRKNLWYKYYQLMDGGFYSPHLCRKLVEECSGKRVLEICAGSGMYSKVLKMAKVDIVATDVHGELPVLREDAITAVQRHAHQILLAIHPMPYSHWADGKEDYLTPAVMQDIENLEKFILILDVPWTSDVEGYCDNGFFFKLRDKGLYITRYYVDQGEFMFVFDKNILRYDFLKERNMWSSKREKNVWQTEEDSVVPAT